MDAFNERLAMVSAGALFAVPFYLLQWCYLGLLVSVSSCIVRNRDYRTVRITYHAIKIITYLGLSLLIALVPMRPESLQSVLGRCGYSYILSAFILLDFFFVPIILVAHEIRGKFFFEDEHLVVCSVMSVVTAFGLISATVWRMVQ